jgi:hypothetical protein
MVYEDTELARKLLKIIAEFIMKALPCGQKVTKEKEELNA